ncbi:uncharacterized protein F5147DRAFT_772164 [Suillus discolor]|uniref:DUF6830 domain-containing protein n=1 Tax=Suillus discolor TaxID=1912936 RepID=A0A9P7JVL2_9AGAM|nr:uncharacterized protein F5147DRAFT_772164 [Suillus discolor]KAG2110896.1 hypothetical protein F5147DRAFT_772164 [Suillus discolor]
MPAVPTSRCFSWNDNLICFSGPPVQPQEPQALLPEDEMNDAWMMEDHPGPEDGDTGVKADDGEEVVVLQASVTPTGAPALPTPAPALLDSRRSGTPPALRKTAVWTAVTPPLVVYVGAAKTWGRGTAFMKQFKSDTYTEERVSNPYFPFAGKQDWEMAAFLLWSDLSMADIDEFLKLEFNRKLLLSFHSSRELRGCAEMLPSPPQWKHQIVPTEFLTTKTLQIFYQDPIECLQSLLSHPMLADSFDFIPCKVYAEAEHAVHVYYGFMTGDHAWELQEDLPDGMTLLGVVLSSDKTKVSNLAGNCYAHPLLITLANIDPDVHAKGSLLLYFLLQSLSIGLNTCMQAAHLGIMMSDPAGFSRYCFTPLVAYVANTPEELVIACITMNASPVTMATCTNFGDPDCHPLRKSSSTLANIQKVVAFVLPSDLVAFFEECKQYHLNGIQWPFWMDWVTADPSSFLTSESLHHFHKMFFDHDCAWCIDVVSAKEIDFRFSLLQMCTRYHTFKEGISNLKQTLGQDHRNIQHYIVGVIAGAAPTQFITAIQTLLEFRYLAQAPQFSDKMLMELDNCLQLFHEHKQGIVDAGAWRGKDGEFKSWVIPKLELLQGVVPSIQLLGILTQWSADPTKHAHIAIVKVPARAGNNHDYDAQVCRHLDCRDKVDRFDLALHICEQEECAIDDESDDEDIDSRTVQCSIKDYFSRAHELINGDHPEAPYPYRTFSTSVAAYHLSYRPTLTKMTVDTVADQFLLPDLCPAISDYLDCIEAHDDFPIGSRR